MQSICNLRSADPGHQYQPAKTGHKQRVNPMPPAEAVPEDEWSTVIRRKKGSRCRGDRGPASQTAAACPLDARLAGPPTEPGLDRALPPMSPEELKAAVQEIETTYSRVRDRWRSGPGYEALKSTVRENLLSHAPVTQAVCLGNGSLYAPDANWDRRRTAHVQTAALLTLAELLGEASGSPIRCVFQEPHYSAVDRSFLEGLGHAVVDDPAAFGMVTDATLLWGVHMYHQVYSKALQGPAPAMFVGTKWTTWNAVPDDDGSVKKSLKRLTEIHATYDMFDFPPDESSFSFCDTCLYWRKGAAAQDDGPSLTGGADPRQHAKQA